MFRAAACLALLAAVPAAGTAQSSRPGGPVAAPANAWANKLFLPDIERNPGQPPPVSITHDFGTVPKGTVLSHAFTLTNIYDVPLQVVDIRMSCGCLEAAPPQRVLQPNEKGTFTVTMDTGKFNGPNAQLVYVTVGPQYLNTAVLRIVANSRADVTLGAPGAIDFGVVAVGTTPAKTVLLEYTGRQRDWAITGVAQPAGPVAVAVTAAGKGRFSVTATLKADAPPGPLADTVSLTTNDPTAPVVPVGIRGVVQSPVQATPDRLRLDPARVGDAVTAKVIVLGNGTGPFKVEPFDDGDGLSVQTLGTASPVHAVTVRFAPTKVGAVRKEIALKTSANGGTTVTIMVEAIAEPASALPPPLPGK